MSIHLAVRWTWIVLGVFWLLTATVKKRTLYRQNSGSSLLSFSILFLGILSLFVHLFRAGIFGRDFLHGGIILHSFGLFLTVMGAALAIWARITLGTNWSEVAVIKQNHALITKGPYAWIRHPIYSGLLLALFGTTLVQGKVIYLPVLAMSTLALWIMLRTEERFMFETFGEEYRAYHQRVKALIPFVM